MKSSPIKPGDLYEDCGYIPRLCVGISEKLDNIDGISLIDGSMGNCSPKYCGIKKIDLSKAISLRNSVLFRSQFKKLPL